MIKAIAVSGYWMEFLYYCRAKFAVAAVNGIRMPIFTSSIAQSNGMIISFPA
jgi:hypothetical protein